MAYDSTRNYAQEINDLIAAGGDPAEVQRLLNERLEKQQGTNSEYSTYDDVYRSAMDYMASKGYTPVASANVDYAEIANQILASQGDDANDMTHRSWADLGTVLDARQNKLATGKYDDWAGSTIGEGEGAIAYNGENSLYQYLKDYAAYSQAEQDAYRKAEEMLRAQGVQTGSGTPRVTTAGGTVGTVPVSGGVQISSPSGSVKTGGVASGAGSRLGYSDEAWEKKQNRENAEAAVGETNAATRVPVQGENSSYANANTNNAFEAAVQALMQGDDREGAQAMQNAWDRYGMTGLVELMMPGVNRDGYQSDVPVYGVYGGGTSGGGTAAANRVNAGTTPVVTTPVTTAPVTTGNRTLTDEEIAAALAEMGFTNNPAFSFASTTFDNDSLTAPTGDTAQDLAVQIIGGGNKGGAPDAEITPVTPTIETQNAAYQSAVEAARAAGDYQSVNEIMAAWNQYKQQTGQLNPQNEQQTYVVEGLGRIDTETMDKYLRMGVVEIQIGRDGAPRYIYKGTSGLSQR